jgi:hypothetical protein
MPAVEQCTWRVEPECTPPPATILRVTGQQLRQILDFGAQRAVRIELKVWIAVSALGRLPTANIAPIERKCSAY